MTLEFDGIGIAFESLAINLSINGKRNFREHVTTQNAYSTDMKVIINAYSLMTHQHKTFTCKWPEVIQEVKERSKHS